MKMLVRSILLISLLLLSACNSTIQNTRIDKNQTLDVNHGVVGVQVINNSDALAVNHKGWTEVIVVRLDNMEVKKQQAIDKANEKKHDLIDESKVDWQPDFYSLTPTQEGLIDSQIFIGSMPDGRYMISSLYSFYNGGDYTSWLTMPVDAMAGIFTVKKGQLTNLGSIVFQPLLNVQEKSFWSQQSSQKAYVTRLNTLRAIDSFLFTHYPNLSNSLNLDNILTWEKDALDGFRSELSTLSRQNAYGKTAMPLSIHGKSVIASKFGQLKWQDKQEKWHQVNLATNSQLAAILETEQQIMVAGERGEIFTTKDWQQAWTPVSRVPTTEAIIWFGAGKNSYYAMTQSVNEYSAYKFSSLDSDWQKLKSFQRNTNNFLTVIGDVFPIITKSGQLSVLNDKKLFQHDLQTDTWTDIKTDSMLAVASLPKGDLVGVEISQWDGIGDQVISQNSGESWISINRYIKSFADGEAEKSVPLMLADGTVLTLGREGLKPANGKRVSSELKIISTHISTANNKKAWQYHGFAKSDCETLLAQISSKEELYFLCDKGDIVFTKDLGMTWQYVIDIEIVDMQLKYNQLIEAIKVENSKQVQASATDLNQ
jgi:hypothetical protein